MTMKKTDLAKNKMLKTDNAIKIASMPDRFGSGSGVVADRKEQRKIDQAAGLIPFACKLPGALVTQLRERAEKDGGDLNTTVAALIEKGLKAK
ncbi:MAG: hypothetical protein ACK5RJ_10145 [Burkholderiales bacterium]|nr:hypothetical protein [Rhodocyclaceae bacterium]MCA3019802.1 hypothetical protein [Rhodocyclaceae bacterium]MCA3023541.1 hypothetical protein [Rhodocyclaceae bacterium]MCA3026929.1 hypothetical protein [Rhodocyclaceae bacterium]MCA3033537.1 hypothetical protein [Rhodocyclaceae bacterium]